MHLVRGSQEHGPLFEQFECANALWYEQEVQSFIHHGLVNRMRDGADVLLMFEEDGDLIGVGAHEAIVDPYGSGRPCTRLLVVAIRLDRRGTRLPTGERISEALLSALINDALSADRDPIVIGLVAAENERSRKLCARVGLREDPEAELHESPVLGAAAPYVWVEGRFRGR